MDGCSLGPIATDWLRENITLVQQHSVLFDGTILQNIALGKYGRNVTIREAADALIMAGGEDIVRSASHSWYTTVGPGGAKLSGGQKQRVSLLVGLLQGVHPNLDVVLGCLSESHFA